MGPDSRVIEEGVSGLAVFRTRETVMFIERFADFLESVATQMPRIVAASIQILSAVEEIVWHIALFAGFVYGVYRYAFDRYAEKKKPRSR